MSNSSESGSFSDQPVNRGGSGNSGVPDTEMLARFAGPLVKLITNVINSADPEAAARRVEALRDERPRATNDQLVEMLIKKRAQQTGAVGAATTGAAIIPGIGTLAALTFGVAADIGATFKLQTDLVLEIAAVYGRTLRDGEKESTVLFVSGLSVGADRLLSRAGREVSERLAQRFAGGFFERAVPIVGVAAATAANALSTYVIGQRAKAYFSLGPEAVGDWKESLRAVSGVDERKLRAWLAETIHQSPAMLGRVSRGVGRGVGIAVGTAAGGMILGARGVRSLFRGRTRPAQWEIKVPPRRPSLPAELPPSADE